MEIIQSHQVNEFILEWKKDSERKMKMFFIDTGNMFRGIFTQFGHYMYKYKNNPPKTHFSALIAFPQNKCTQLIYTFFHSYKKL